MNYGISTKKSGVTTALSAPAGFVSGGDFGCPCSHLFNIDRFILFLTPFHPVRGGRQSKDTSSCLCPLIAGQRLRYKPLTRFVNGQCEYGFTLSNR